MDEWGWESVTIATFHRLTTTVSLVEVGTILDAETIIPFGCLRKQVESVWSERHWPINCMSSKRRGWSGQTAKTVSIPNMLIGPPTGPIKLEP